MNYTNKKTGNEFPVLKPIRAIDRGGHIDVGRI